MFKLAVFTKDRRAYVFGFNTKISCDEAREFFRGMGCNVQRIEDIP
jgi:hypothetical protein